MRSCRGNPWSCRDQYLSHKPSTRFFLGGLRPPKPSCGWGSGETRFPQTPAQGLCPHLPEGGGVGEPGSPMFTLAHPAPQPPSQPPPAGGRSGTPSPRGEGWGGGRPNVNMGEPSSPIPPFSLGGVPPGGMDGLFENVLVPGCSWRAATVRLPRAACVGRASRTPARCAPSRERRQRAPGCPAFEHRRPALTHP